QTSASRGYALGRSSKAVDQGAGAVPSPSAPRGAEVRRRLLDAAVRAIPEQGWRGVSTRSLARRAGVVPGLVHYHFDSLEALLREAALGALREELAQGAASLRAAPSL